MARILVIDDEPAMTRLLRQVLEDEGHEVLIAGNHAEAVTAPQGHPLDLVITDVVMPNYDGIRASMELKRRMPHLRVIVMSAGGAGSASRDLSMTGDIIQADAVIAKPFEVTVLLGRVREALASAA